MAKQFKRKNSAQMTEDPSLFKDPENFSEFKPKEKAKVIGVRPIGTPQERNVDPAQITPDQRTEIALEGQIREQAKRNIAVRNAEERILQEQIQLQKQGSEEQAVQPEEQAQQEAAAPQQTLAPKQGRREQFIQEMESKPDRSFVDNVNLAGAKLGAGSLKEETQGAAEAVVKNVAQLIDAAVSVFSQKKQTDVIAAEGALNDVMGTLQQDIELVKIGAKSPFEVRQSIQRAEIFLNNLSQTQKGIGKANLRYWLTDGKEVEAKIILETENLQDFKTRLAIAEQQAITARARQRAGLTQ